MAAKTKKILLVHFHPLEQYPPAMNLVDYLGQFSNINLKVITNTVASHRKLSRYRPQNEKTTIFRPARDSISALVRYLNYVTYYLASFFIILFQKPDAIIYIETLSAFPAVLFKRWRKNKMQLLAHYHEYTTPEEYASRMFLSKWMHQLERKEYPRYNWISQTNPVRLKKFIEDTNLQQLPAQVLQTFANYPPASWLTEKKQGMQQPVKLVYVGSLGYGNMYLKELVDWLHTKKDKYTLDIYAHNLNEEAKLFLDQQVGEQVTFCGGCDYQSLPQILKNYDVGLVIYKPFSENTIHAVSNKVFEYLACGLDVWYSVEMTFTLQYTRLDAYPKIVPVDFRNLADFNDENALGRAGLPYKASTYFCEKEYQKMASLLLDEKATLN